MTYYDSLRDPVDNAISDVYHWKSSASTGSSTTIFDNLVIPSSPNFPNSTATRYMLYLPGEPYYDGVFAGTHPIIVKDVNTSTILTRVSPNGTLVANTFKIFQETAITKGRMEINVGIGSCQPNDIIAFDGYFVNSIQTASELNKVISYQLIKNKISGLGIGYQDVVTPSVGPGYAHDITNGKRIYTSIPISKTLALGIDTGSTAQPSTFYYIWIAENTSGTVRLFYSLSSTSPTLPSDYVYSSLVGVFRTNSVSQLIVDSWKRNGDEFDVTYATPAQDVTTVAISSTRTLKTLTAPPSCKAKINFAAWCPLNYDFGAFYINYGDVNETDSAPTSIDNSKIFGYSAYSASADVARSVKIVNDEINLSTASQIYVRGNASTTANIRILTNGFKVYL